MRFLHLSDTHNQHRAIKELPESDVLIHSGDFSFAGTKAEFHDFLNWFFDLDYPYKIFIGGNHDNFLERKSQNEIQKILPKNCYYLRHSGITIDNTKFWGIPKFISEDIDGTYFENIRQIPTDIDVLVSHHPPLGVLDRAGKTNFGCADLLQKVLDIQPKLHLFGHIHDAYGTEKSKETTFSNASVLNENYKLQNLPVVFDL